MDWAFPTSFPTSIRHNTPGDLHSILTIIRTICARGWHITWPR